MRSYCGYSSIYKAGSGPPCTKNIAHLHAELSQFCMYAKHFFRTCTREAILHVHIWPTVRFRVYRGGGSGPPCTKNIPQLHSLGPQFCMYTSGAGNSVSVSIVHKTRATTRGRSRGSTEEDGASQRRLLSTQFLHEDGSGLVSTALDKRVLRLLVQFGGLFFSGPGPYLGLQLVIFLKLFDD